MVDDPDEHDAELAPSRAADRFKRTTGGQMLGAFGLAIDALLRAPREEAPIEVQAPGAPPGGRETEMELDPDDPAASVVRFSPRPR